MDISTVTGRADDQRPSARWRWWVHLGLIGTVTVSLVFEFVLAIHVIVGLVFATLVVAHLAQRRDVSLGLLKRLTRPRRLLRRGGRLAPSDLGLLLLTVAMLVSGFVDLGIGHPTRTRWHALSGVGLALFLVLHTLRRRSRLRP